MASDPRFARLKTDPRFRRPKKQQSTVAVDDRFKSVFDNSKKKKTALKGGKVDKYGRSVSKTHEADSLRRFYRLKNDEGEEEGDEATRKPDLARGDVLLESSDEEDEEDNAEESDNEDDATVTLGQDRSRPITVPRDEELEVELDEDDFADLDAQALAAKAEQEAVDAGAEGIQATRRIAVVNMDWDHIKAPHLYKIFSSVVSVASSASSKKGSSSLSLGRLLNVRVYPSQFGKERMAREEVEGPPAELFGKKKELSEEEVNEETVYDIEEEGQVDDDALRTYQLDRMRFYYAIAEFDSAKTAERVFNELEGTELERSANVFDLSYVPEDMTFDEEPRDEAKTETSSYKGLDFVTDALRHSKVKLTWDEDDPERTRITRRAMSKKDLEQEDYAALIASSSDEDDDEDGSGANKAAARERMRALLVGSLDANTLPEGWGDAKASKTDDMNMEITFTPGLSEQKDDEEATTLERYQKKIREQRKKRKEEYEEKKKGKKEEKVAPGAQDEFFDREDDDEQERKERKNGRKRGKDKEVEEAKPERKVSTAEELALLATADNLNGERKHFDMKSIVKVEKGKGRKAYKNKKAAVDADELQEDFAIDVKDDRFTALHEDYSFAIDPSNPQFKKTKSMTALLEERSKRRKRDDPATKARTPQTTDDGSQNISRLVESVKRRTLADSQVAPMGKRRRT